MDPVAQILITVVLNAVVVGVLLKLFDNRLAEKLEATKGNLAHQALLAEKRQEFLHRLWMWAESTRIRIETKGFGNFDPRVFSEGKVDGYTAPELLIHAGPYLSIDDYLWFRRELMEELYAIVKRYESGKEDEATHEMIIQHERVRDRAAELIRRAPRLQRPA